MGDVQSWNDNFEHKKNPDPSQRLANIVLTIIQGSAYHAAGGCWPPQLLKCHLHRAQTVLQGVIRRGKQPSGKYLQHTRELAIVMRLLALHWLTSQACNCCQSLCQMSRSLNKVTLR